MVKVKILGILDEDTVVEFGAIKLGTSTELLTLEGEDFLKGSIYDNVLLKKGLLDYTRNLVRLMMDKTDRFNLGSSTLTINVEDMCTNKFIIESGENENLDSMCLSLLDLNIYDSFVTVTKELKTFISGVVKDADGEDSAEIEIYLTDNVAVTLPDPTYEDASMINSLMTQFRDEEANRKEGEKVTNRVVFNSFAVGLGLKCEAMSEDKTEALRLLDEAYKLAKNVINAD